MKRFTVVELINSKPYSRYNLEDGFYGAIIEELKSTYSIMFNNPYNTGRFIVAEVLKSDVRKTKEQLPEQVVNEFYEKWEDVAAKSDSKIEKPPFATCDKVELIAERQKYAKYGIHKGDVEIVCFDEAVSDGLEVAFPTFDENGDELGDVSFAVLIEDLKLVKKA